MFKNILKFLFEEEQENVIDEPLEDISLSSPVLEKKEATKPMKQKSVSRPRDEEPTEEIQPIKVNPLISKPTRMESEYNQKNHFINYDEPQRNFHSTSQGSSRIDTKRDYEFSPVISPIFGTKEDILEREAMGHESAVVRVKKKNPLGTIISPMFGATELEEMEDKAQEKLAEDAALKHHVMDSNNEFVKVEPDYKNILNMTLQDILEDEDEEESDEVMQFSLFGGEEAMKTKDEKSVFVMDEEE